MYIVAGVAIVCFLVGVMVGEVLLWHKITDSLSDLIRRETKYYAQKAVDEILNKKP